VAKPNWIEVSLTVSPEQAEAVAEVLSRTIPNGVVVEQKALQDNSREASQMEPAARVFGYLLADSSLEDKKQKIEECLWHLGQIQPLAAPIFTPIIDEDWMAAWKKHYQPIEIGRRLVIAPSWIKKEFPGRLPIRINPGMAFGTGTHPSTQLCLRLMEDALPVGENVIDVGCGSGILSIAAFRLGTDSVLAVDVDPAAMQSTLENAKNNHIHSGLEVGLGSVSEILAHHFSVTQGRLVVVNILANIILQLFGDGLADLVLPGGQLILAGILDSQAGDILFCAEEKGLRLEKQISSSDWVALLLRKSD
jgi:ribosomal protein L11 methyltransferase